MKIYDRQLGEVYIEIYVDGFSAVDSYIEAAWTGDTELSDIEIDRLNEEHSDIIQAYAYEHGSKNHN